MNKSIFGYVFCLLFIPSLVLAAGRYNNALPTCEELGYSKHTAVSTQAIFCPFDSSYSVNIDSAYRGFVPREEIDADYAAYGRPEDFCELETRVQGQGNSQRTLYRCKQCKTAAFEAGLCVEFCDEKKFPYSKRPEDLYGVVIECKDANGTRYAFSSCNNGWTMDANGVRCDMDICDRNYYPYVAEPNRNRGAYESFKSATNLYYGYKKDLCNSGYEFKSYSDDAATGVCIKKCAISNCRLVSTSSEGIQDYKCDLPSDCQEGDTVTFNNIALGFLLYKAKNASDKNLILSPTTQSRQWGGYGINLGFTTQDNGKLNTKRLVEYAQQTGISYPAAQYAYEYSIEGITEPALAKGQWYLPSVQELANIVSIDYCYLYSNIQKFPYLSSPQLVSSTETEPNRAYYTRFDTYQMDYQGGKGYSYRIYPMLAI